MQVYNHDVAAIIRRIKRFREEIYRSQSSNGSQISVADQGRLTQYFNAIDGIREFVVSRGPLDMPETHPFPIEIPDITPYPLVENECVIDIITMLEIGIHGLANSESARHGSSLNFYDNIRLQALSAKLDSFLNDYVKKLTPLDLPESSPKAAMVEPGKLGVSGVDS